MRLSIVIPAYSEATCLGECLRSIENELARGAYDAEPIVLPTHIPLLTYCRHVGIRPCS